MTAKEAKKRMNRANGVGRANFRKMCHAAIEEAADKGRKVCIVKSHCGTRRDLLALKRELEQPEFGYTTTIEYSRELIIRWASPF